MKSFGARAAGERLARMRASAQWVEGTETVPAGIRNRGPMPAGLRDTGAARPTLSEFLCGGTSFVRTSTRSSTSGRRRMCRSAVNRNQQDKDWFYRAEERRWISLNDNSGWRRIERVGKRLRRGALRVA